jgi:hypothetical protein
VLWSRVTAAIQKDYPLSPSAEQLQRKGILLQPPLLEIFGEKPMGYTAAGFSAVYAVLFANLQASAPLTKRRYAIPGPAFSGVYLWDSAFIALVWKDWDASVAVDVLCSVIDLRDGDRLQHMVSEFKQSVYTQPPLISWAAAEVGRCLETNRRERFYRKILPPLSAYHRWLRKNRRLSSGLYAWSHPYESGTENSPRFSNRDESRFRDTRLLEAPDFSTYVFMQCQALSSIARELGEMDEARGFEREAEKLRHVINRKLWHEQDGMYYDRDTQSGTYIPSRTIASLMPLAAGIPTNEQANRLLDHILDENCFGTRIPFPSVSLNDTDFCLDMWRGPVWVNTAYLVLRGLYTYGRLDAWANLSWRLIEGVYRTLKNEHQIYEFYDPQACHTRNLKRKQGNLWKALTLGTGPQKEFVGWTGLVNTLLIDLLLGPERTADCPCLRPCLPERAQGVGFHLCLPGSALRLRLLVHREGEVTGTVERGGRLATIRTSFGERLPIFFG